jgi:UDP-GlcNAc:undecaprenyl-phosphate GlcNAc-1-phosphate transferase
MYPQSNILNLYLISSGIIVFVGALDDYKDLSVGARLTAQTLIATIMVYGAGVHLQSFGDLFGFGVITLFWFGYPITVLATIASINAFNMSDGIDGLAGSLSLISFVALGVLMYLGGSEYFLLPMLLSVAILPFLAFNLGIFGGRNKKIFMGDAGSMFVGLSVVWLLVLGSQDANVSFRPVTALWLIGIPLMDMCAITIRRAAQGRSPFLPDRDHLHHIFLRLGLSSKSALTIISMSAILLASIGVLGELKNVDETIMFSLFVIVFLCYYYTLKHIWRVTKFVKSCFHNNK